MKRIFFLFLMITFFFPLYVFSEAGQVLNIDGYKCHISATQLSSKLIVNGDVSGGDSTDLLRLRIYLADENGTIASVTAIIERYRGSGRFSVKESKKNGGNRWIVTDVYISK